jgi:hypothetical protein
MFQDFVGEPEASSPVKMLQTAVSGCLLAAWIYIHIPHKQQ